MKPTVSLILPTFNAAKFLPECIESIYRQTRGDWECIVVDDGSTDNSAHLLHSLCDKDPRFRIIHQENKGLNPSCNVGRSLITPGTPFITFPNSDDVLEPDLLDACITKFQDNPSAPAVGFNLHVIQEEPILAGGTWDRYIPVFRFGLALKGGLGRSSIPFESIFAWGPPSEACAMFRTKAFDAVGGWPEDMNYGMSVMVGARLALNADIPWIARPLYGYRWHGGNMSIKECGKRREATALINSRFKALAMENPSLKAKLRRGVRLRAGMELRGPLRMAVGALRRLQFGAAMKILKEHRSLLREYSTGQLND